MVVVWGGGDCAENGPAQIATISLALFSFRGLGAWAVLYPRG
jgi:hypothetical protein